MAIHSRHTHNGNPMSKYDDLVKKLKEIDVIVHGDEENP